MTVARYRGSGHAGEPVARLPGAVDRIPPATRAEGPRLRLLAFAWNAVWEAARRLPEPLAFGLADLLAIVAHTLAARRRALIRGNLARVLRQGEGAAKGDAKGEAEAEGAGKAALDSAVRQAFRSYARYWVEAFRAADLDPADLDARTTTEGFEHLDGVLEGGRGAIVLLAHHGSWDVAARWAESHGYHLAVVAEVVRPRALFAKFVRLREAIGLEVVPLRRRHAPDGLAKADNLAGRLTQVLAANHMVGLLSDRDLMGRAPLTPFFGEGCRIPAGPVVLARRTGAPIVPITMLQLPGRRWHLRALPPLDVSGGQISQASAVVAAGLEALIRTDPRQWHAFSAVWPGDSGQSPSPVGEQAMDGSR